ncbi:MAG: hypothetical protein AB1480_13010 [Nitrospirota bacterium]
MHSLIFPYNLVDRRYIPVIPIILYGSLETKVRTEAYVAHALHGKARKLIYRSPVTGDVVIFDHSPY